MILRVLDIIRGTADGHGTIGVIWARETNINIEFLHHSTDGGATGSDKPPVHSGIDVDFNGELVFL